MAIQEITSPPLLDETGQDIATALESIASAVNSNAGQIDYSNTASGLTATKVQGAIDEVKDITDDISSNLAQLDDDFELLENNALSYKGLIPDSDANNVTSSGIYYNTNILTNNTPSGNVTYSYFIVFNFRGVVLQISIKPILGIFAMRENSGSPATWSAWKNLTVN